MRGLNIFNDLLRQTVVWGHIEVKRLLGSLANQKRELINASFVPRRCRGSLPEDGYHPLKEFIIPIEETPWRRMRRR